LSFAASPSSSSASAATLFGFARRFFGDVLQALRAELLADGANVLTDGAPCLLGFGK
jgi:hypothetical protein